MKHITGALITALALTLAACGTPEGAAEKTTTPPTIVGETTTTEPATPTSEATTTTTEPTTPTPSTEEPSAGETLDRIRALAESGDLEGLAALALGSDDTFTASFGQGYFDPAELASYWQGIAEPDIPMIILGLFETGSFETMTVAQDGSERTIMVWPAAMGDEATPADRRALEDVFGTETVNGWYADGMYLGWRMGVDEQGIWRFLVAGD
jgi:hypothetical protein